MKYKILFLLFLMSIGISYADGIDADTVFDMKQNAFALYNTSHIDEAYDILTKIPEDKKDEEVYLILSNIEGDKKHKNKELSYLKLAVKKNPEFYKAYYNMGCIFMERKIYTLAVDNFELAVKYNDKNAFAFYNLGCAQMNMGDFRAAKKNFIKAIYLKNDEKDFYYNLAYVNKKLGKEKDAQKVIDFYNQTFIK